MRLGYRAVMNTLLVGPLMFFALFTLWNAFVFKKLRSFNRVRLPEKLPKVSLLVPARNEEDNLEVLLPSLIAQDYPNLEIIVLNDHSTDRTRAVADRFASTHARLRVIEGGEMLEGWMGKPNACRQLAQFASGELLLFTDADTVWKPNGASLVVKAFQRTRADALSAWPEQVLQGNLSRLMQPFMAWSLVGLLPISLVPDPRFPDVVSANGQLIAFKRECFDAIDGFEAGRASVLEDMAMARAVSRAGMRFWLLNGAGTVKCKMYSSSREVFSGFAKSAYTNLGANPLALIASIVLFCWFFIGPWVWLISTGINGDDTLWPWVAVFLSLFTRVVSDITFAYPPVLSLLQPFAVVAWTVIAVVSAWRYTTGRVRWKGRVYDLRANEAKPKRP
jgi:chlorobactene glucosyltransferase